MCGVIRFNMDEFFKTMKAGFKMNEEFDVKDMPEDEKNLIKDFIALLRNRREAKKHAEEPEKDWGALITSGFANDWDNEKDAEYDNWKERYHVHTR